MENSLDDFWNSSSSSAFNFDDEDLLDTGEECAYSLEKNNVLSINLIISKASLGLILNECRSESETSKRNQAPPSNETKHDISSGVNSVSSHRHLKGKLQLLDSAIDSKDGIAITKAVLFLKKTLKPNIFYHQLSKRRSALKHYIYYLITVNDSKKLIDVYMATGNTQHMKDIYYFIGNNIKSLEVLYRTQKQFMQEHLQKLSDDVEWQEIIENLELIKLQIERKKVVNKSLIDLFAQLCYEDLKSNNQCTSRITEFQKNFNIDEATYEWIVLNVLACLKKWDQLSDLFIKKKWLKNTRVLKTVLPVETIIHGIYKHGPPPDVFELMLSCCLEMGKNLYSIKYKIDQS